MEPSWNFQGNRTPCSTHFFFFYVSSELIWNWHLKCYQTVYCRCLYRSLSSAKVLPFGQSVSIDLQSGRIIRRYFHCSLLLAKCWHVQWGKFSIQMNEVQQYEERERIRRLPSNRRWPMNLGGLGRGHRNQAIPLLQYPVFSQWF